MKIVLVIEIVILHYYNTATFQKKKKKKKKMKAHKVKQLHPQVFPKENCSSIPY